MRSSTLTPEDLEKIVNDPGPKVVLRRCDISTEKRSPKKSHDYKSANSRMGSASKSNELSIAVSRPSSPSSLVHNSENDSFFRKTKERLKMELQIKKPIINEEWLGIVMWDSKVFKKMELNEVSNFERYTQQGLGKMLSKSVSKCNKNFSHNEPYILVDVVEKEISYAKQGFLKIRVAETTFFKNMDTPVNERTFDLLFPFCMAELAEEIVRLPLVPTTLMIWNCEVWKSRGNLARARISCHYGTQPRILIFHHEVLHPNRRRQIQNQIRTSELKFLFESGKIQKCFTFFLQYPDNEESLSVHIKPKDSSSKPDLVLPTAAHPENKSNEEGLQSLLQPNRKEHPHVLAQSNDVDLPSSQIMDYSENPDNYQFTALLNDLV